MIITIGISLVGFFASAERFTIQFAPPTAKVKSPPAWKSPIMPPVIQESAAVYPGFTSPTPKAAKAANAITKHPTIRFCTFANLSIPRQLRIKKIVSTTNATTRSLPKPNKEIK